MTLQRELEELTDFLKTVRIVEDKLDGTALKSEREETRMAMTSYIHNHAFIHWKTLNLINDIYTADQPIKILELGSAPYFFTVLVQTWREAEVTPVNMPAGAWPGEPLPFDQAAVRLSFGAEHTPLELTVRVFNIEKDPFPFPSDSFDLVLFMEVLEHLAYSPTHVFYETHRVLKPEGKLLVTVPNCLSIKRLMLSLANQTFEYPYSGYGIYGRHQREFAAHELRALLQACNYQLELLSLDNAWRYKPQSSPARRLINRLLEGLTSLPIPYLAAKRDYIFALCSPIGQPRAEFPDFLYRFRQLYPLYDSDR